MLPPTYWSPPSNTGSEVNKKKKKLHCPVLMQLKPLKIKQNKQNTQNY